MGLLGGTRCFRRSILPAAIEAGELTPRAVFDRCVETIAARDKDIGAFMYVPRRLAARRYSCGRSATRLHAAPRPAGRVQGHFRHRRFSDAVRLADLCRLSAARRCNRGRADAARRRNRSRQDGDHRDGLAGAVANAQSAQCRAYAGRLLVGLRRRRRRRNGADRLWHANRRLGDPSGRLLRRRRLQAVLSAHSAGRRERRRLASRHRRPVRRRRRRRRLCGGRDLGARPARRPKRVRGAAHRARALASVAAGERRNAERG